MTRNNLTVLIDAYGSLMAKRAKLEGEKKDIEKSLADLAPGAYEGDLFRLSISDSVLESYDEVLKIEIKTVTDAFLAGKSDQYIRAHTVKKPSRRHAAKARNGDVE